MQSNETAFPITLGQVIDLLDKLHYFLEAGNHDTRRLHFQSRPNIVESRRVLRYNTRPPVVTILKPDKTHPRHSEPVYDRSYVLDLLRTITGDGDGSGDDPAEKIIAVLKKAN